MLLKKNTKKSCNVFHLVESWRNLIISEKEKAKWTYTISTEIPDNLI